MYKVTVEIHEYVEANSPEEAKQKFLDNFEFHDIYYGDYEIKEKVAENTNGHS